MSQTTKIAVKGLKINTLLPPAALPPDLVPPDGQPAGNPALELELEGGALVVRAALNGKAVRRVLKMIAEHGADNVNVVLQGVLKPPPRAGEPFVLETAGIAVTPKAAKPGGEVSPG